MTFTPNPIAAVAFAVLLLGGSIVGLVAAGGSLLAALSESPAETAIHAIDGVPPNASIRAFHAENDAGDAGCVLTDDAVMHVESGTVQSRVPLRDATVRLEEKPLAVHIDGADGSGVSCTFRVNEGVDVFAGMVQAAVRENSRPRWRSVDPRVRRFYEDRD